MTDRREQRPADGQDQDYLQGQRSNKQLLFLLGRHGPALQRPSR